MLGHVEVDDAPALVGEHDEDEEHPQARDGTVKKSMGNQVPDVVDEERPQGWDVGAAASGGDGSRPLDHLDPQRRQFAIDSGRAQSGLAAAILVTRALISALTGGRPSVGRPESLVPVLTRRRLLARAGGAIRLGRQPA